MVNQYPVTFFFKIVINEIKLNKTNLRLAKCNIEIYYLICYLVYRSSSNVVNCVENDF